MLNATNDAQPILTYLTPTRGTFVLFVMVRLVAIWLFLGLSVGWLG